MCVENQLRLFHVTEAKLECLSLDVEQRLHHAIHLRDFVVLFTSQRSQRVDRGLCLAEAYSWNAVMYQALSLEIG